jgi:hypothetical protein
MPIVSQQIAEIRFEMLRQNKEAFVYNKALELKTNSM